MSFEVASAQTLLRHGLRPGDDLRLPARHGRPGRRGPHVREALTADGTWLIVEPAAGDTVADNLNPVGRMYYSFSTFLCVPNALSQPGGHALGHRPGEAAIRQVDRRRRLHPVPPGRGDPVQPRLRGPARSRGTRGADPPGGNRGLRAGLPTLRLGEAARMSPDTRHYVSSGLGIPDFAVATLRDESQSVVTVAGEVDVETAPRLRKALISAGDVPAPRLSSTCAR